MGHFRKKEIVGRFMVSTVWTGYGPCNRIDRRYYETSVFDDQGRARYDLDSHPSLQSIYRKSRQAELGHQRIVDDVKAHPENYKVIHDDPKPSWAINVMKGTYNEVKTQQLQQSA